MPENKYYYDKKNPDTIRNASRLLVALPGGVTPGPDKHKLFHQLYAALMQQELELHESAALVRSGGEHGSNKPLSGGQRKRCRRMARRLAQAHVTSPPMPERRVFSRKPRKDPARRAVYYRPTGVSPDGHVILDTFAGGRGRASSAGFPYRTHKAAEHAHLRQLAETGDTELVATAINAGYIGPLPEGLDDDAVAAQKPGMFAKLWNLRKIFG